MINDNYPLAVYSGEQINQPLLNDHQYNVYTWSHITGDTLINEAFVTRSSLLSNLRSQPPVLQTTFIQRPTIHLQQAVARRSLLTDFTTCIAQASATGMT